jgi:hypothetical protein
MKKVILGVFAIGLLAACGGETPDSVATAYLTALKDKKWEEAKALGTDRTKSYVGTFESLPNMESGITEVKDVKCETSSDTSATCSFCCSNDGKTSLSLVKRNGKWLVDDGKQMPEMGEEPMMEEMEGDSTAAEVTAEEAPVAAE